MTAAAGTTTLDRAALAQARQNARAALLAERVAAGHWEGELSSSALSTATAIVALTLFGREKPRDKHRRLIAAGCDWLRANQNADGGWGDTTRSFSNISTTTLCWAALGLYADESRESLAAAEKWLTAAAGSREPKMLAAAIARRYGRDRTFSVPILTMCALCGRLGEGSAAWRLVPQLPFEIAALPQSWFRFVRLPVVSYALPALIAIGQVRHALTPTWNPITRLLRWIAKNRTLRVLQRIQPTGGGFLEATPLTSFVTMSLIGAGRVEHPVVAAGVDFLVRSARPDGSWPIDTNLTTWVTTLSVNALGGLNDENERERVISWLLNQQLKEVHPYTGAAPGGWAWTDLPGGVPDADDTPGALIALHHLAPNDPRVLSAAAAGVRWLLDLQNSDGGMPTFCRGWGALPFDRSGADLTAHVLHAWSIWRPSLPADLQQRIDRAAQRSLDYLQRQQRPDGAWSPLWFGDQHSASEENLTYGASRVLAALGKLDAASGPQLPAMQRAATNWLLSVQSSDGGWGGSPGSPPSIEETALAIVALASAARDSQTTFAIDAGLAWLVRHTQSGTAFPASPIGFYFAKLWYFERLYPLIWSVAALESACALPHDPAP